MKLQALAKRLKKTPAPASAAEYQAILSAAASVITGPDGHWLNTLERRNRGETSPKTDTTPAD